MGDALFELENNLRSKQANLTPEEVRVLSACKSKAMREFTFGGLAAGVVAWTASSKLSKMIRLNLSGGAAAMFGLWRFSRALDSCVEHILALDGSRMQAELATIMVTKHQNDRQRMQLISKQFYCEEVFDDSTSERPKIRWRYRNYFSDNIAHGQRTHDSDSYSNSPADSDSVPHGDYHNSFDGDSQDTQSDTQNDSNKRRINFDPRRVPMNSSIGATADPFEYIFGYPAPKEELHLPDTSSLSPKAQARNRRRSHRKRRTHHQEDVSSLQHV
ncbi:uncharacterized protein LOC133709671 [Rosa rugosa]|uniref:uncharacterized protein LOC133709671 n=1 Tax=Rosa rugosa TaxID=74645 RepID=UPI002B40756A|nr:uncharacterized protein LOC133709671 [Rosa rugosa]